MHKSSEIDCEGVLRAYLDGQRSAELTLTHLLIAAGGEALLAPLLSSLVVAEPRLMQLAMLAETHRGRLDPLLGVLERVDHDRPASVETIAHMFDEAVSLSECGSVAIYSLGDETLLDAATDEIVHAMARWDLLGTDRRVLEIGCGIGRFARALSTQVGTITGIDVSPRMIDAARRRCAELPNVALATTPGRDLSGFADQSFDLVFAVDVFPYLMQAGDALAARHIQEAHRVLVPGGTLLVLGYSYRTDDALDRREVVALAHAAGFTLDDRKPVPFARWDGLSFRLRK